MAALDGQVVAAALGWTLDGSGLYQIGNLWRVVAWMDSMIRLTLAVQTEKVWRMASGSLLTTLPMLDFSTTACFAAGWWDLEVTRF